MKKFVCLILTFLAAMQVFGGGTAQRFKDVVFQQIKRDSVQYCVHEGHALLMDVYQPVGDTTTLRPLVILAHGGSFIANNRRSEYEESVPAICRALSKRGYVTVSIDYRLTTLAGMSTKPSAYKEIIKSVADGRASIIWFLHNIATTNTYRIDKNKIFFGGNSAGAILAEQLLFIDSSAQCKPVLAKMIHKYLADTLTLAPHALRGLISLAGAVLDTNIIHSGLPALLHIQGDADHIVQYGYGKAIYGLAPFKMAGLGASRARYKSQHLNYTEYVFKKGGHTPWDRNDETFNVMLQQLLDFLGRELK